VGVSEGSGMRMRQALLPARLNGSIKQEHMVLKHWAWVAVISGVLSGGVAVSKTVEGVVCVYAVGRLKIGQSFGNSNCYATLDSKTDVLGDRSSVRYGLRESTNQKYYLLAWEVALASPDGVEFAPDNTTFTPAYQESELVVGRVKGRKQFFVPFETGYLRSAHFLLDTAPPSATDLSIQPRIVFPPGAKVEQAEYRGYQYVIAEYPDGAVGILWGSDSLRAVHTREAQPEARTARHLRRPGRRWSRGNQLRHWSNMPGNPLRLSINSP
jgi:hypothetical protein